MEWKKGMLAISKAGHDKDTWYVVYNIEGNHVDLVDGRIRTIRRPKRKKKIHLQPVNRIPEILKEKLETNKTWTDEEIKRALKLEKQD